MVDEPSKFHSRRSATDLGGPFSRVMVLQRRPPSPSIQTSERGVSRHSYWWLDPSRVTRTNEKLTLGLDSLALVKGHVRREEVNALGGDEGRHG